MKGPFIFAKPGEGRSYSRAYCQMQKTELFLSSMEGCRYQLLHQAWRPAKALRSGLFIKKGPGYNLKMCICRFHYTGTNFDGPALPPPLMVIHHFQESQTCPSPALRVFFCVDMNISWHAFLWTFDTSATWQSATRMPCPSSSYSRKYIQLTGCAVLRTNCKWLSLRTMIVCTSLACRQIWMEMDLLRSLWLPMPVAFRSLFPYMLTHNIIWVTMIQALPHSHHCYPLLHSLQYTMAF